jgi:hypothetical protein
LSTERLPVCIMSIIVSCVHAELAIYGEHVSVFLFI